MNSPELFFETTAEIFVILDAVGKLVLCVTDFESKEFSQFHHRALKLFQQKELRKIQCEAVLSTIGSELDAFFRYQIKVCNFPILIALKYGGSSKVLVHRIFTTKNDWNLIGSELKEFFYKTTKKIQVL